MLNILFSAPQGAWKDYEAPLTKAFGAAGLNAKITLDAPQPELIDYIIFAPDGGLDDFTPYTGTKGVLSLWAGVDQIIRNPSLTQPLIRMVDEQGLTASMVEWVSAHVLRHHLGIDRHIVNPDRIWDQTAPPLARERKVTILGMGQLGTACAQALTTLGFDVTGWSRTEKNCAGVTCFHGQEGLETALSEAEITVLLLPDTQETTNLIGAESLGWMPRGGILINPGRGPLIDDDALLSALKDGQISHATLDVFRIEPLPQDHPFWSHPRVTVTPHIAAATRPQSAAFTIISSIQAMENGQKPDNLVNRNFGY